jgi:outer membrane protein OmpA-like peptidoglycan-associated protein
MTDRKHAQRLPWLIVALLLAACAATPPPPQTQPPPPLPHSEELRQRLHALPQAQSAVDGPLLVTYPEERLFADGAVLPLPGGTRVLDPLALLLREFPDLRWQATVRAQTEISTEYDQTLAQGRAQLLERYLHNRQVRSGTVTFRAAAEAGPPLEIVLLTDLQAGGEASSSAVKR